MKRIAILVAAVVFTLNLNIKVFATGVENASNMEVNQTTVGVETTQASTTTEMKEVVDDTNISTTTEISTDANINEETGIMPDSAFYFFDKAFDNFRLFLTFDDEKKIEILSQIADERLSESENMTEKEKYELAKVVMEEFNSLIAEANDKLNVLVEDNDAVLDEEKEIENEEVNLEQGEIKLENPEGDKLDEFQKDILSKQLKCIEVLKKLSDKLDGNAKEAIEAVIEMQIAKKEAVAKMVEKRHELNAARQEYQLVKINLEVARKTGDEEAIKAAEEVLKEKQSLYEEAKTEYSIAFEEKKDIKNGLMKDVKKAEKKNESKGEAKDTNAQQDAKLTTENSSEEIIDKTKVVSTEEKITNSETKNAVSNIEAKKVKEEVTKKVKKDETKEVKKDEANEVKENAAKKVEESKKKTEPKLENKEAKSESIKEMDKKIKEEVNEKASQIKENNKDKKENKKN